MVVPHYKQSDNFNSKTKDLRHELVNNMQDMTLAHTHNGAE